MKKLMWTLIAIIVIGGISFGGYQVYGMGYDGGEKAGYTTGQDDGYQSGQKDGYQTGYQTGNDDGMVAGKKLGYTEGYGIGEQAGYKTGYSSGLATGTQAGYQDGYSKGETTGYDKGLTDGFGHGYTITDPTWAQVQSFILSDTTDRKPYITDVYMCGDFAREVHNNAERAGIRAAYVAVNFKDSNHALNAFKTTDRGLVFIDCTGIQATLNGPSNRDKTVNLKLGKDYIATSLFPEPGWSLSWSDMGRVLDVEVYW